ncbi:MAG: hydroxymethylbilane synthase [Candidatus Omnitrophica bacterium]|nr:hydroxymethylbilane synthase [Candidatus Omnitrophota bacterium]
MKNEIRIGTRGSALAVYQAELVKNKIERDFRAVTIDLVRIKTGGDMIRRQRLSPFQTKRVFTREIEEALLKGEIDLAVHSAKDMSVNLPEGLRMGAVLEREDARDCLVSKDGRLLADLPAGARIGTSSPRRKAQVLRKRPDLVIREIHGNVDTRIRKLHANDLEGMILAVAGLKRLGLMTYIAEIFPEEEMLPSPGQGAIVVEVRDKDDSLSELLRPIHHGPSGIRLACERAFLRTLGGGCQLPCGVMTRVEGDRLSVKGMVLGLNGEVQADGEAEGLLGDAEVLGKRAAEKVLEQGGHEILERVRHETEKKEK